MDDLFRHLLAPCTFEELALRLTCADRARRVRDLMPDVSPRTLLSAAMVVCFPDTHHISRSSDVYARADEMCAAILENAYERSMYDAYKREFAAWLERDSTALIGELTDARARLAETDGADPEWDQWNDGVAASLKMIDDSIELLKKPRRL